MKHMKIVSYTRDSKGRVVNHHLKDISNTIHGSTGKGGNTDSFVAEVGGMDGGQTPIMGNNYRIRKLTPRECFRLMSVSEDNINKIQSAGISNSQQYKLAGNSIDVNVLKAIFRQLFRFNEI